MKSDEINVIVHPASTHRGCDVFMSAILSNVPHQRLYMSKYDYSSVKNELDYNPSFSLSQDEAIKLYEALKYYFDRHGISIQKEDHLKGKVESMDIHLGNLTKTTEEHLKIINKLINKC